MVEPASETPSSITAGNSASWLLSLSDYPASSGWSVTYYLINSAGAIDFSSTASGDDHLVSLSAVTTGGYDDGDYTYTAVVDDGTDRYTVETGSISILPDPSTQTAYDGRSQAERIVYYLKASFETNASKIVLNYTIGGRRMEGIPILERLELLRFWEARVSTEKAIESGKKGNKVLVRFV
jgi:hypothetical protein